MPTGMASSNLAHKISNVKVFAMKTGQMHSCCAEEQDRLQRSACYLYGSNIVKKNKIHSYECMPLIWITHYQKRLRFTHMDQTYHKRLISHHHYHLTDYYFYIAQEIHRTFVCTYPQKVYHRRKTRNSIP